MGRVTVEILVANNTDFQLAGRGQLDPSKVAWFQLEGAVDTGSAHLVLPSDVADRLAFPKVGEVSVVYADRRSAKRQLVEEVRVELLGRQAAFRAILEPNRTKALIGAIVLEELDLLVDCPNNRVYPRDPTTLVAEVE